MRYILCRNEEFVFLSVRRYILTMKAVREAKKLNLSVGDDLSLDGPNLTLLRDHIKQNNG